MAIITFELDASSLNFVLETRIINFFFQMEHLDRSEMPCWWIESVEFFLALCSGNKNVRAIISNGFDAVYGLELERNLLEAFVKLMSNELVFI